MRLVNKRQVLKSRVVAMGQSVKLFVEEFPPFPPLGMKPNSSPGQEALAEMGDSAQATVTIIWKLNPAQQSDRRSAPTTPNGPQVRDCGSGGLWSGRGLQ